MAFVPEPAFDEVAAGSSKQVFVAAPLVLASPPHVVLARASVDARGEVGCAIFPRWMKLLRWRLLLAAAAVVAEDEDDDDDDAHTVITSGRGCTAPLIISMPSSSPCIGLFAVVGLTMAMAPSLLLDAPVGAIPLRASGC